MKARTVLDVLTLASNIYTISKDEELMKNLSEMASKGKEKWDHVVESMGKETENLEVRKLLEELAERMRQARADMEVRMKEVATNVYSAMHIANADEVDRLQLQVDSLSRQLKEANDRITALEAKSAS